MLAVLEDQYDVALCYKMLTSTKTTSSLEKSEEWVVLWSSQRDHSPAHTST